MNDTSTQIMDAAQAMIREGGYYGFSFRQIADQLSIKSASVHYHFPTKEALAKAVAERYTENFLQALGEPARKNAIRHYVNLFKSAFENDGRACLCSILAGEAGKIPESLRETLRRFRDQNIAWLEAAFEKAHSDWPADRYRKAALGLFSGLEGGMTFAALNGEPAHFEEVAESLLQLMAFPTNP